MFAHKIYMGKGAGSPKSVTIHPSESIEVHSKFQLILFEICCLGPSGFQTDGQPMSPAESGAEMNIVPVIHFKFFAMNLVFENHL